MGKAPTVITALTDYIESEWRDHGSTNGKGERLVQLSHNPRQLAAKLNMSQNSILGAMRTLEAKGYVIEREQQYVRLAPVASTNTAGASSNKTLRELDEALKNPDKGTRKTSRRLSEEELRAIMLGVRETSGLAAGLAVIDEHREWCRRNGIDPVF